MHKLLKKNIEILPSIVSVFSFKIRVSALHKSSLFVLHSSPFSNELSSFSSPHNLFKTLDYSLEILKWESKKKSLK